MKVRIGYGLGVRTPTLDGGRFGELVDALEALRFDSLWLSERVTGASPDPMVGLAFAAGRTSRLKLGTSVQVLPGRNLHLLAKAWASLDRLSSGRCLPAFGLGVADPRNRPPSGSPARSGRGGSTKSLPKLRALWAGEEVDGAAVAPTPVQSPMDVWLGGNTDRFLRPWSTQSPHSPPLGPGAGWRRQIRRLRHETSNGRRTGVRFSPGPAAFSCRGNGGAARASPASARAQRRRWQAKAPGSA